MIFWAMILLGCLLGFAGAGGAGLTITLLSVGFGVPIHTALGVALAAMSFTMLSGAVSHFREGDVLLRLGLTTVPVCWELLPAHVFLMPCREIFYQK